MEDINYIDNLPNESLNMIFDFAISRNDDSLDQIKTIKLVCHKWHNIMTNCNINYKYVDKIRFVLNVVNTHINSNLWCASVIIAIAEDFRLSIDYFHEKSVYFLSSTIDKLSNDNNVTNVLMKYKNSGDIYEINHPVKWVMNKVTLIKILIEIYLNFNINVKLLIYFTKDGFYKFNDLINFNPNYKWFCDTNDLPDLLINSKKDSNDLIESYILDLNLINQVRIKKIVEYENSKQQDTLSKDINFNKKLLNRLKLKKQCNIM